MLENYLGKEVVVKVDRPLGSRHPKYNYIYPLNYGYIPGTKAADGEEIDAYILGEPNSLDEYKGIVIGIVHRKNDIEDKLIVSNKSFSLEEIQKLVHFQEQYFNTEIILKGNSL
ncbi:inorganic diphosphatase [Priestia aryabhattai]|uniref:inorganic diphosphatase n=1 Tax=Priestia aryabhattai TaxID=412384 RepID=UPI00399F6A74